MNIYQFVFVLFCTSILASASLIMAEPPDRKRDILLIPLALFTVLLAGSGICWGFGVFFTFLGTL